MASLLGKNDGPACLMAVGTVTIVVNGMDAYTSGFNPVSITFIALGCAALAISVILARRRRRHRM
jgi:hypothetical protein